MVKASFEMLQPLNGQSFLIRRFDSSAYDAPYHFHPEYELTLILNATGKRYVGSSMENFVPGDLVLLGPNLPHCWKLEPGKQQQPDAGAIVIQFAAAFLGRNFFEVEELQQIKQLLSKSECGVRFNAANGNNLNQQILSLTTEKNNFQLLIAFIQVLQLFALSGNYELLDKNALTAERNVDEQERINPIFNYLIENFRQPVSLKAVAAIANMTTNAFCKYFKKTTRKTFMETIIEYRLNYAVQQLVQTEKPVSLIASESGFGDVSHFHKTFKSKMGMSPLSYRKNFTNSLINDLSN